MKTIEITDRDAAIVFGRRAFQIVLREVVRAIFYLTLLGGIEWRAYRILGENGACLFGILIVPTALWGIPHMFKERTEGAISDLLRGNIDPKFLGFGPDKID
jgi:hypothetical protein